jgi:hypothetical protein
VIPGVLTVHGVDCFDPYHCYHQNSYPRTIDLYNNTVKKIYNNTPVEAPQRRKGRAILSEFHKNVNSETFKKLSFLDETILNISTLTKNVIKTHCFAMKVDSNVSSTL